MSANRSDEHVKTKLVELSEFVEALEGGHLHLGAPYEGRNEAWIHDLERQIAMYESIFEKRQGRRT